MERILHWLFNLQAEWPFKLRLRPWSAALGVLFLACVFSALAAVTVTYQTRVQYAELQRLEQERNQLQTEWGQLLLEEGAWSTPARIEQMATDQLGMRIPDVTDVEVIRP